MTRSSATGLRCLSCTTRLALEDAYHCPQCSGILEVVYDYRAADRHSRELSLRELACSDTLMPVSRADLVSLGEGSTPLIEAPRLARELGLKRVLLKCEFTNPTGSFKDRPISVGISKALQFGNRAAVVASTGNAAASVAAYAARAGMPALVLVPEGTSAQKISQTAFHGAYVVCIRGAFGESYAVALDLARRHGYANLSTTFLNPYTVEGNKSIAFELCADMDSAIPDAVYIPVGAGPMLVGIANGYRDLCVLGRCRGIPPMIAVQAEGCCPIAAAFERGDGEVGEEHHPDTIAHGIGDGLRGYAADGTHTLSTVRASGGRAMTVSDQEILDAQRRLARVEGLFVEPTGAAGVAGMIKNHTRRGQSADTVVVILSGHGLKDRVHGRTVEPPLVEPDPEAVIEAVGEFERAKEGRA